VTFIGTSIGIRARALQLKHLTSVGGKDSGRRQCQKKSIYQKVYHAQGHHSSIEITIISGKEKWNYS